jgi:hypothetical protein
MDFPTPTPPVIVLTAICKVDSNRIYTGETVQQDIKLSIPSGWIVTEPPSGDGIWQFNGTGWTLLTAYPTPAPIVIPRKEVYLRADFIDVIDKAGLSDSLGALLSQAPILTREQWYANPTINITDPRVVGFFQMANIRLEDIFK